MPEKILKNIKNSILPQWKVCFFSAIIVGFLAHLYKITNWLPNWDSLVFRYDPQLMLGLGRWFLPVVCSASSFYDLPFLNGMIAIVFYGLGAVCICKVLKVEKNITAFLVGALVVSFPTVTSVLMYNYVADGYSIAFFLSCLAAVYLTREKPNFVLGSVFISLSSGIYQAYVTVTILLVLLYLIDQLIFQKQSISVVLKKGLGIFFSGAIGMILYYVVLHIVLHFTSYEMLEYQGLDSAVSLSNFNILGSLYNVKETLLNFFFDFSNGFTLFACLNVFIFVIIGLYCVKHLITNQLIKSPLTMVMLVLLLVLSVLGSSALAFINPSLDYHNLMLMGYVVFYLFFVILYERGEERKESIAVAKQWVILLLSLAVIFDQIVISNVVYHKATMAYEKSYGVLIRVANRIEQLPPEAENAEKLLVVGSLEDSQAYSANVSLDITGVTDGYIIRADDEMFNQSVFCSALNDYCQKSYQVVQGEQKRSFLAKEEVKEMNIWPAHNSVRIIDDVIVVKFGLEVE